MTDTVTHAFKGVVFDLDGTLTDTEAQANHAAIAVLADMGADVDIAIFEALAGVHDAERRVILNRALAEQVSPDAFLLAWRARINDLREISVPIKPDAHEVLTALKAAGYKLALATSSHREQMDAKLAKAGLAGYFDALVPVDDVAHAKPAPDPYILAAERLGLKPVECVAFEDTEVGAEAAFTAGLFTVQVPDIQPASGKWANLVAPTLLEGAKGAGLI
ncbi:HAD family hydrolase [Ketogulonicigenium vulgare]|uniref:Hydrolase, haloacid dehalogenase-like protein family protein n=1 Tax=Ketogulonicigenium vulgare (strain WSH-001) TaxID=759362 RepID=F9YA88_KETVW|nr:HAD family phosphatase [Ketogulonicigenium vulgare]ADO42042.1 HAD-superfamily hydrolase, subfamily IA, variant 3 [Ketogulonicigenium vulgare Y25]AEM40261.1 Hydrolase, haloacid dehalogenase-like protein family protein [Ketogulonicigenium vulgare WSH-001]ALJ80461.1 haloacid dehalogenase [Ketogulonicigenium vulgare]ANW33289.1 haloacid dehalogenase [Ketogulonicigenium vulgare]AOZ53968.1 HAD-superfamily hydrolase, subfamily IA, variant 3 [Ketogulonicigenium vulgare]